jgi:hypothetical protein
MRIRPVLVAAAALCALASPSAFAGAPAPQVTDPAGDANFLNPQREPVPAPGSNATPVGSQDYADVVSVTWAPDTVVKKKRKVVVGFTVTTVLTGAPTPPAGSTVVYRMLGQVNGDSSLFLGVAYYSSPMGDTPQSAVRDNLTGTTRLTKIDLPTISGNTMTWKVPLTALPKEFKPHSTLTNLYFETSEIESFQGQTVPSALPVVGGSTGLGYGVLDTGTSTSSFKVG